MKKFIKKSVLFIFDALAIAVAIAIVIIDRAQVESVKIKDYLNN